MREAANKQKTRQKLSCCYLYGRALWFGEAPASALCGHADHAAPCHVRCAACAADVAHPSSPPHRDSVTQCARIAYLMAPVAQT